jgi:hypothetical protein
MQLTHKVALAPGSAQRESKEERRLKKMGVRLAYPPCFKGKGGAHHDRDHNAAINLQRLATATALPAAKSSSNGGPAAETVSAVVGEETPVRHELGQQDSSGQEKNRAYLCALS